MTTLIETDFLNCLKSVVNSWPDDENKTDEPIIKNPAEVYQHVKTTFELRHIYCHEYTGVERVNPELIKKCFENTKIFLEATDCLIRHLIRPTAPRTQAAMNQLAIDEFNQVELEMNEIYKQVLTILDSQAKNQLEAAQEQWVNFRERQTQFWANEFEGGSIFPVIYYSNMKSLTRQRIDEFNKILEIYKQYAQ